MRLDLRPWLVCCATAVLAACGGPDDAPACASDDCGTTCATGACATGTGTEAPADTTNAASSTGSTTAPAPDTTAADSSSTAPECTTDDECAAPTPHCSMGSCVTCSATPDPDGACAALDPDAPLCEGDACVQCREGDATVCTGTVPVCDTATNTCVGCSDHAQCPLSACHFDEGSCMPEDRVWFVDGDAANCGAATGTPAAPYCTVGDALAQIGQASRGTLRVFAASEPYTEAVTIDGTRVVAVLAADDGTPEFDATGAPTLTVDGATLFAWRLRWRSNAQAPAIVLDDAIAWIDRSEIVQNQGGGIDASNGSLLHLRTSVVGAGGTGLADRQALRVDGATIDVVASSIAGNDSSMNASIRCLGGGGGSLRNSIVVGLDPPSISCLALDVADSVVDTPGLDGDGNTVQGSFNAGWFVDAAGGDFHLVPGTLFEDAGIWRTGDPPVDLDGDARPTRDGALDVVGADVP